MEINNSQIKAINHNKGAMMVLAGPGSGKTLVITRRTQELIEQYGVKPERILVITFTKAAAMEMKERFLKLYGGREAGVSFGTFHAVFFKIIKYAYHYSAANVLSEEERFRILRNAVAKLSIEIDDEKDFLEGISSEISLVKSGEINLNNYYAKNCSEENFKKLYHEYGEQLKAEQKIDFDDMMLICLQLLNERKDILEFWQQRYEYILIDEFQDINPLQYKIIRLLALPQNNVFIVGDDDQSIYRFRGAKPEIMLGFERDYPQAERVLLDRNYRCMRSVTEYSLSVIRHNRQRFEKEIIPVKKEEGEVNIKCFKQLKEENKAVITRILDYYHRGIKFKDMAVLFRTNTQPRVLIEGLSEYNIPFRTKDRIPNIYEHWIAKNLIAYMEFAGGNMSRELFLQICNRPKRYISRSSINESIIDFEKLAEEYADKPYMIEKIDKLVYDLHVISRLNPFAAIKYIRKAVGYDDYLKEYADYRRINLNELLEIIEELQDGAKEFETFEKWKLYIDEYGEELRKQEQRQREKQQNGDCVELMTFHSAKGLEFRVVFIIDANETITPHRKSILPEDIEEERRMFYVAMTRAKEILNVFSVEERFGKQLEISRFVGEMLLDIGMLKPETAVEHVVYGKGIVKKVNGGRITIKFEEVLMPRTLDIETCVQNRLLKLCKQNGAI